jgi:acetyltransferase
MIFHGFKGEIFPVNPNYKDIMGVPAFHSIKALPKEIDMAIIATPINYVPEIIADCGDRKMGGAVIISAGGKEAGKEQQAFHGLCFMNSSNIIFYKLRNGW